MIKKIAGKRVLITGAAQGVGAEAASILAEQGARLALIDIDSEKLARTPAARRPDTLQLLADVGDRQQMSEAVARAVEAFGGLDVVVANAGIIRTEPLMKITRPAFEKTLDVNLLGVWHTVRESMQAISASSGYILVVSSLVAAVHLPYMSTYDASKAGVEAFAKAIRSELRIERSKVKLGIVYFSIVDTGLAREAAKSSVERSVEEISNIPLLSVISPARAARAIVRGIKRRSLRIVVPWYYRPLQMVPNVAQRIVEIYFRSIANRVLNNNK